jgi:hypothetical protein
MALHMRMRHCPRVSCSYHMVTVDCTSACGVCMEHKIGEHDSAFARRGSLETHQSRVTRKRLMAESASLWSDSDMRYTGGKQCRELEDRDGVVRA